MCAVACEQFTGSEVTQQDEEYSNVTNTTLAADRIKGVAIIDCDTHITESLYRMA